MVFSISRYFPKALRLVLLANTEGKQATVLGPGIFMYEDRTLRHTEHHSRQAMT